MDDVQVILVGSFEVMVGFEEQYEASSGLNTLRLVERVSVLNSDPHLNVGTLNVVGGARAGPR